MFCKAIRRNATPFVWAISGNAKLFVCTLYHSTLRWAISRNATPFVRTLCYSTLPWAISSNATPFVRTLCYSILPWAISSNATPFGMCAVLFDIALSHFTQSYIVCVYTVPFDIKPNYSCLWCSVSWRKTKPSIIWPCYSFISYAILQPILRPALYLLIYLTSLYFWW